MDNKREIQDVSQSISKDDINLRIIEKRKELVKLEKDKKLNIWVGIPIIIIGLIILNAAGKNSGIISIFTVVAYIIGAIALLIGIFGSLVFFDDSKVKSATQELMYLEDDKELLDAKNYDIEAKAEKQFQLNQRELKRYYDLNLSQTKFLSHLGIGLMLFGVVVISGTIYFYIDSNGSSVTLLLTGSISGVLVNFLGAMFISSYTKTFEAAVKFHSKLANSNNLLLANAIASKIKDESLRNQTLSEVAKNISATKEQN